MSNRHNDDVRLPSSDKLTDMFSTLCTIHADVSQVPKVSRVGLRGIYYRQSFKVILLFGLAELKAQLSWNDNVCFKSMPRHFYLADLVPLGRGEKVRFLCPMLVLRDTHGIAEALPPLYMTARKKRVQVDRPLNLD